MRFKSGGIRNTDIAFFFFFHLKQKLKKFKWCWNIKRLLYMCHWFNCICIWNKHLGMFVMVGHQRNRRSKENFQMMRTSHKIRVSVCKKVSTGPIQSNLNIMLNNCCCLVAKSCLSLQLHGLQHDKLPCPSLSPELCSNSCPLSWWSLLLPSIFLSQHQGIFQWDSSNHVAKIVELHLQHQSFQGIFRVDFF